MTELQKHTIRQIAEKKGDRFEPYDAYTDIPVKIWGHDIADTWLLGYLLQKSTLVAVFGSEEVCINCGNGIKNPPSKNCHEHRFREDNWEHRGQQFIGLSLEQVLDYYGKYLGEQKL